MRILFTITAGDSGNARLAIIPFKQGEPLASFFEFYHRHRRETLNLILKARPVL